MIHAYVWLSSTRRKLTRITSWKLHNWRKLTTMITIIELILFLIMSAKWCSLPVTPPHFLFISHKCLKSNKTNQWCWSLMITNAFWHFSWNEYISSNSTLTVRHRETDIIRAMGCVLMGWRSMCETLSLLMILVHCIRHCTVLYTI